MASWSVKRASLRAASKLISFMVVAAMLGHARDENQDPVFVLKDGAASSHRSPKSDCRRGDGAALHVPADRRRLVADCSRAHADVRQEPLPGPAVNGPLGHAEEVGDLIGVPEPLGLSDKIRIGPCRG